MRILFVGDVIGQAGRKILATRLAQVQREQRIDFTIVNVENAAGGFGITPRIAEEILALGADVMTSGNHIWDRKEVFDYMGRQPLLLRPANYPTGVPGYSVFTGESAAGVPLSVVNLQGRVFMANIDCPFQWSDREIPKLVRSSRVIIVDFHAEATSEKMALGWHLDGKVSALIGTHTHVPTADGRILPKGTAYLTDVGMTGAFDSVIGMQIESSLARFLTGIPSRFETASDNPRFSSVVLDIDEDSGRARLINRLDLSP